MTEQFQRYNEPYIMNMAYNTLKDKGVDTKKYFMKALRYLAQRAPIGISAKERIEILDNKYSQALTVIAKQNQEIESLKLQITDMDLIIKLKDIR